MCKNLRHTDNYPFQWLDELIEINLNPGLSKVDQLQTKELAQLEVKFNQEIRLAFLILKKRTFFLNGSKKIKATVAQFELAADMLLEQARNNLTGYNEFPDLLQTGRMVLRGLEDFKNYILQRYSKYIQHDQEVISTPPEVTPAFAKILCTLSVDQIGIILKAADDVKLIVSRSLSYVFKSIVPHLSTNNKKNISWDSMRSSTYHPEESDKEIAIAMLEKMISKIRHYN